MRRIIKNLCDQRKTALLATEIRTQETEALSLLLHGLESAKNVQCKEAGLWCCDINLKQYSDGLLGLSKALEKIIDGKGTLDAAQNSVNKAASVIFRGAQEVYHTDAFLRISELAKQIGWNYDVDGQC